MRIILSFIVVPLLLVLSLSSPGSSISLDPFGPLGEGGSTNGQAFTFGAGGEVFQLDAFFNVAGFDLNGPAPGTSAQLSAVPLPAGLNFEFSASLSPDTTDLTLTYTFLNFTGITFSDVQFFSFLDAEIDEPINSYFNEFGEVTGDIGLGAVDPDPDSWEIDEPGFVFGDIFDHLLVGALDDTNAVPAALPDDVSLALGFRLGDLKPLEKVIINILISEDGDSTGSLALVHGDIDPSSTTVVTMSGQSLEVISAIQVEIDIKPGSDPDSINLKSKGVVPVAILTTDNFDATSVDPLSVEFGPNGATESHGRGHIEDVDDDSDLDLVLHFRTQETGIQCGDITASLSGKTFSGQAIGGSDSIKTTGCK